MDDVPAPCIESGCKELGMDPRRITDWNLNKTDLAPKEKAAFLEVVCSPEFVEAQRPYPGAAALIEALREDGHARHFVRMKRRHNRTCKGFLSVESYEELLSIRRTASVTKDRMVRVGKIGHPGIICLVGPSASGKPFICDWTISNNGSLEHAAEQVLRLV